MKSASLLVLSAIVIASSALAQVKITNGPDKVSVEINGKPFTDFYVAGAEVTKPYLWPLRAASGTYVTRMWPMEKVEEEASIAKPDHIHQRGLWFAHDSVNGIDFWNNDASYDRPHLGNMVLDGPVKVTSGKTSGTITATFDWVPRGGQKILTETRVMTFYADRDDRRFDVDITLTAVEKVVFGDGKDGAFGIRIRPVLQEDKGTGHITNADGLEGEKQLWGKPSNWCDYSGEINGEKVGIAILDNPANPRHPVRWHARAYGLFAANPFGVWQFDKTQPKSELTIEPGQKLHYQYRVIIHAGDAKTADIAAMWDRYTGLKASK